MCHRQRQGAWLHLEDGCSYFSLLLLYSLVVAPDKMEHLQFVLQVWRWKLDWAFFGELPFIVVSLQTDGRG